MRKREENLGKAEDILSRQPEHGKGLFAEKVNDYLNFLPRLTSQEKCDQKGKSRRGELLS